MSDKPGVYDRTGTYMYWAHLAMYAHVQSKQVMLLTKEHVCAYIHKFHIFHSSNNSLGFIGLNLPCVCHENHYPTCLGV